MKDYIKFLAEISILFAAACVVFWYIGFLCGKNSAEAKLVDLSGCEPAPVEVSETIISEPKIKSLGEFTLTAYCPCKKCCGKYAKNRPTDEDGNEVIYTASGAVAIPGYTCAVDPSVIPYGTEIIINGKTYVAQDSGSAVKGKVIDIMCSTHSEAAEFGKQTAEVFIK